MKNYKYISTKKEIRKQNKHKEKKMYNIIFTVYI